MARDGLLPPVCREGSSALPHAVRHTIVIGIVVTILAGLLPIGLVGELVSIGTLFAFVIVCLGVLSCASPSPAFHARFARPRSGWSGRQAAATSIFLMFGLPVDTWIRFGVWLIIGLAIYAVYGARHSRLRASGNE